MKRLKRALAMLAVTGLAASLANAQEATTTEDTEARTTESYRFIVRERHENFPTIKIPGDQWVTRLDSGFSAPISLFSGRLFNAETVLENAEEIELTADQRSRIIDIAAEAQAEATRRRLAAKGTDDELDALLTTRPIDEAAALDALDRVLSAEAVQKRQQLASLIAVRNTLTEAQIDKLQDLRRSVRIEFIEGTRSLEQALEELEE